MSLSRLLVGFGPHAPSEAAFKAENLQPCVVVEKPMFHQLLKTLKLWFNFPSKSQFTETLYSTALTKAHMKEIHTTSGNASVCLPAPCLNLSTTESNTEN